MKLKASAERYRNIGGKLYIFLVAARTEPLWSIIKQSLRKSSISYKVLNSQKTFDGDLLVEYNKYNEACCLLREVEKNNA